MADVKCTFCGKSNEDVEAMVATPDAAICDKCVMDCLKILVYGEPDPVVIDLNEEGESDAQSDTGC